MSSILKRLRGNNVLVCDGAWGTMLLSRGLTLGECPERWNIEHPEDVLNIARAYVDAGVDIVQTNSFGGNRFRLMQFGLQGEVTAINQAAVRLSRLAAGPRTLVWASMGPTGVRLCDKHVGESTLHGAFFEQAQALASAGPDAILIETMTNLREAREALAAVQEATDIEAGCTFTFRRRPNRAYETEEGYSPATVARELCAAGASFIGANCNLTSAEMVDLVAELREAAPTIPILAQPNAGQPLMWREAMCYPETPESMASWVPALVQAGANIVGGCCGTTPEHIRAMRRAVEQMAVPA